MYKHASRNLQRSYCVDRPLPTGGYIGSSDVDDDFIPSAANLGLDECRDELRQLGVELTRAQNELIVAKRANHASAILELGHRIQGLVTRRSTFKTRITQIREQGDPSEILAEAIRAVAPDDIQAAIFRRARELNKEKYG